ncbi:MAG: hypothetical protein F4X66_11520 [Chloroflexi bacterium]|nr:hypothetical protein [Chloroflexota bacterium]MYE41391.1 hypothetical protein [Chloroflexota bacterium]
MRPGEEIRLVKDNLAFAVAFWKAASAGNLSARAFRMPGPGGSRPVRQDRDPWDSGPELPADLTRGTANQMRAAFALAALQARRSLAVAFPGEPIEQELPELRTALSVMHLIALAVRRSIIQPVWDCPPPYRRLFHIRRLGFTLNATGLGGRPLSWDDFGGLDSYIDLLEYCAASADEAGKNISEQGNVLLPDHPSALDFDDIIGPPPVESDESGEIPPTPVRPPADYNGGAPPPGRVPVMPAAPVETALPQPTIEPAPVPYRTSEPPAIVAPNFGSNPVDRFVTERCETGAGKRMLAGELYAGFLEWGSSTGQEPISQRAFGMRLTALGLRRKRRGHGKHWWEGIRVAG